MNHKKLKKLSEKLNLPDAKLLARSLMKCARGIVWTSEQKKRIKEIKKKMAVVV